MYSVPPNSNSDKGCPQEGKLRIGKRANREDNELLAGDKEISVFGPIEIEIQTLVAKMYHLRKPECRRQVGLRGVWREPSKSRFSLSQ